MDDSGSSATEFVFPNPSDSPVPSLQTVTADASSFGVCHLSKVQQRQEIESSAQIAYVPQKLSDLDAQQGSCSWLLLQPQQGPSKGDFREPLIRDVRTGNKLVLVGKPSDCLFGKKKTKKQKLCVIWR